MSFTESTISAVSLQRIINTLKNQSRRTTTRKNYYSVWKCFNQFYIKLDRKPTSWEDRLTLFVGYLVEQKKKSQTIRSYISAIRGVLKDDGVDLNKDKYLLSALTKACKYKNDSVRMRLPISKSLLEMILRETKNYFLSAGQPYLCRLYRALFATSYYGLLRVGELTSGDHPVRVKDVQIAANKNKMLFILRTSKMHWSNVRPQTVKIISIGASNKFSCPFQILREYADVRRTYNSQLEPFFRWFKFSLKPPYTVAHGNLSLAIWDTSHWTSFVKFGLKTA